MDVGSVAIASSSSKPRVGLRRVALAALVAAGSAGLLHAQEQDFAPGAVLRQLRASTRDIYDAEEARENLIYWFANTFHATTDEDVVRTEMFFHPGDIVTPEMVKELERNLRAMRLFGEVRTDYVDLGDGFADVDVATRDRFSLLFSASGSVVGGVTKYSSTIGERNLFGTGKRISVTAGRQDQDDSLALRFVDPQLFDTWYQAFVDIGYTSEGPFGSVDIRKPFKHLEDPLSHGASGSTVKRDLDYYAAGEVVASVPEDRQELGAFITRAFGPRDLRGRIGVDLRGRRSRFEPTTGEQPTLVAPPGDIDEIQIGMSWGVDWNSEFRIERRIDALDYDEDIRLGAFVTTRTAVAYRSQDGPGESWQPIVELDLRVAVSPIDETFATFEATGGVRWDAQDVVAHRSRAALHVFQKSLPSQTIAMSLLYDHAEDKQDLPPQLTLGEDNGLRGYPARALASDRYFLLNIEDRINTGLELWSVHLGLAAFFDIGWIDDPVQGVRFSDGLRSTGIGLRLGSSELLGGGIVRIDLALPLDDLDGENLGLSISASRAQLFTFFGNASELTAEFDSFDR